jgi:hypothetical protein
MVVLPRLQLREHYLSTIIPHRGTSLTACFQETWTGSVDSYSNGAMVCSGYFPMHLDRPQVFLHHACLTRCSRGEFSTEHDSHVLTLAGWFHSRHSPLAFLLLYCPRTSSAPEVWPRLFLSTPFTKPLLVSSGHRSL